MKEDDTLKLIFVEVPVKEDCHPSFTEGRDGIFRRTDYCHKANPNKKGGFLEQGYDVPASFLAGFTEADVLAQWTGVRFDAADFLDTKVEVPTELFTALNRTAAQAWEAMLNCAGGKADGAREMYRTANFTCAEEAIIRSRLQDLRSSLPMLASSLEVSMFFDRERVERKYAELNDKRAYLLYVVLAEDRARYEREYKKLQGQMEDIREYRDKSTGPDFIEFLQKYIPQLPRMHPLLTQVLVEELLSQASPSEMRRTVIDWFKRNRRLPDYMMQLLLWMNSIDDRDCAALGLWPSANRAALQALGADASELGIGMGLGNLKGHFDKTYLFVSCPMGRSEPPGPFTRKVLSPFGIDEHQVMRLSDAYNVGRYRVWQELRDVRERYQTTKQH
jgi:hypothetical protein